MLVAFMRKGTVLLALSANIAIAAPLGNEFVYQGQLKKDGVPIDGLTDLEFTLWDAAVGGAQVDGTHTILNVDVDNGLFNVGLNFGGTAFNSDERWLQIRVRHPAGVDPYVLLEDRQLLTATPYAHALRLPVSETFLGASNVFSITNSGAAGSAGVFALTNVGNVGPALSASAAGGTAFSATTPATGTAVSGNSGLGRGGSFTGGGGLPALLATNNGTGAAISAVSATGAALQANGDLTFNDDEDGIVFSATLAPSVPMMSMFALGTGNAPRMVIAHSLTFDNYGLQYEDTEEQFHFLGNGIPAVSVDLGRPDASPSGGGFLVVGASNSLNIAIDNNEIMARNNGVATTLALNAAGGNVTLIQSGSGGVSIGTTVIPAGVRLAVDGKVLCEEMEVQLSGDWPDFVFEDEYELMPLEELEQSVAANKHLPGIPSAAEVAKEGVNVGEMQTKLLHKVEELTLYMIEMNKEVEAVRAENERLLARIAQLEGGR